MTSFINKITTKKSPQLRRFFSGNTYFGLTLGRTCFLAAGLISTQDE